MARKKGWRFPTPWGRKTAPLVARVVHSAGRTLGWELADAPRHAVTGEPLQRAGLLEQYQDRLLPYRRAFPVQRYPLFGN